MAPHQRMSLGDNIECESPGAKRPYRGRRCANKFAAGKTAKWAPEGAEIKSSVGKSCAMVKYMSAAHAGENYLRWIYFNRGPCGMNDLLLNRGRI